MKRKLYLLAAAFIIAFSLSIACFATGDTTIYLDSTVEASGDGLTESTAVKTLTEALGKFSDGRSGNIKVIGEYDASSSGFTDISGRGKVTISGYSEDSAILHGALNWSFYSDTVFDDIEIRMVAAGYKFIGAKNASLEIGKDVEFTRASNTMPGFAIAGVPWMYKGDPPESNRVTHTKLVMRNSNSFVRRVYGSSCQNTYSAVRVTNDATLEIHGGAYSYEIYGTGERADVDSNGYYHDIIIDGNLYMTITGGTFNSNIAALGDGYSTVKGNAVTNISGGSFASGKTIYISSISATNGYYIGGDAVMTLSGGTFASNVTIGKAAADNIDGKEIYIYQNGFYDKLSAASVTFGYASRLGSDTSLVEIKAQSGLSPVYDEESGKIKVTLGEGKALFVDGVEQVVSEDGLYSIAYGSHELTVGDESDNSVAVVFDLNCDDESLTCPSAISVKPGNVVSLPTAQLIDRTAFYLIGWAESADATEGVFEYTPTGNITLYAVWGQKEQFTIYFDDNLGDQPMNIDPITAYDGDTVTLSAITGLKSGKRVFNGWAESADATEGVYEYTVTKSCTLYGTWKALNDVTIPASMLLTTCSGYGDSCSLYLCTVDGKSVSRITPNPNSTDYAEKLMVIDRYSLASYGIDLKYYKYARVDYFYDAGEAAVTSSMNIRYLPQTGNGYGNVISGRWASALLEAPAFSSTEPGVLNQFHLDMFNGITAAKSDGTERVYVENVTFSVEPLEATYNELVYAANPYANTKLVCTETTSDDGYAKVSEAASTVAQLEYVTSYSLSLCDVESNNCAEYGQEAITVTVEKGVFEDGIDFKDVGAYYVVGKEATMLSMTETDDAFEFEISADGEVVFVAMAQSLPVISPDYRLSETEQELIVGIYLNSGKISEASLEFEYDASLLEFSSYCANDGFSAEATTESNTVDVKVSGTADATNKTVHIADIVFTFCENVSYDKTEDYFATCNATAENSAYYALGLYEGKDENAASCAIYVSRPSEYEYPYGFITLTFDATDISEASLECSPAMLGVYYSDGTPLEGFPATIENVNESVKFIVENGEYTVTVMKNGFLSKTFLEVPVSSGQTTELGEILLEGGDISNSLQDNCGDGVVDIDDFIRVLRAFSSETDEEVKKILDVNGDGENTVADIALVKAAIGKKAENTVEVYGMPKPDYFNNIYTKLIKDSELTIGYMGGSITDGEVGGTQAVCWRNQTTAWFKEQFPEADITAIKASLGGTDTYLASFRVDNVLLDVQTPDLVFIEYASNDYHEGNNFRSSARQLESIILKLRKANPNVDIIVIFSFRDFGYGNPYVTQAVRGMWTMADYYGVKVLPIGYEAYETYKDVWYVKDDDGNLLPESFTNDGIHLSEFGHDYYTERICSTIGKEIVAKVPGKQADTSLKPQTMPEKFHTNTLENSYMVLDMTEYLTENTTFVPNGAEFSWATPRFPNSYIGSYNSDTSTGNIFEFKFTGTEVGIVYARMSDNAYIRFKVDDGKWHTPTSRISGASNPKTLRLFQGLENCEHTVTIEVLGTKPSDSTGYNFRIGALLINPDDSAYSSELASPSLLKPDGTYEDVSVLADPDPEKTEWDCYAIVVEE